MSVDQNVVQTSIQRQAPFMEDYIRKLLESGYQQSQEGMTLPNQQIAGLTPQQLAAAGLVTQGIGAYQPFLNQAAQAYTPENIRNLQTQFMDPFTEQVIDQTQADIGRLGNQQQQALSDQAVSAGAFGGGRQAIGSAEIGRNVLDQQARTGGQLRSEGFNRALQTGLQTAGAQAGNLMNVANLQSALGTQDINSLLGIGGLLQGQQQSQLDATRANELQQMYEPYQRLSYFSDLLRGVPSSSQTMTSATSPSTTNPFGTALGYGLTGLGIAGQLGYQPFGNPTSFTNPYGGMPYGGGMGGFS
tara:strand:- start:6688 stop:7593 length:906 start_codon:yes stop_codon:yes gene_type:complete